LGFGILGPLIVTDGSNEVALPAGKQRALLAVLLLRRNEVVSTDALIDALWRGRPPARALKIVQVYVSRLRGALADDLLVTQPPGYVLRVQPGQLDVERAERLLAEGRRALADGAPQEAAERLRDALALWRGPPLADFAYEDFAQAEIGRLEQLRLGTLEERIDSDLALGRHADLVPEVGALVAEHPLRERLRGQLMLALYRSGRQAEALDVYRDTRRVLDQELGLEPSAPLQALEREILTHDPALDPPPSADRTSTPAPDRPATAVPPSPDHSLIAIMHVDLEGSTALATSAGDQVARRVIARTKQVVREGAEAEGGREIDAVGDSMMLTFGSARAAIGAGMAIQETLAERECERPEETLRVRIGINVGEVLEGDGHPFGAAVNAGARVMAKADGGEILVSELAQGLAGTIPGVSFRDRGTHRFKGFDEPWRLYQVVWPGAPAPRPSSRRRPGRLKLVVGALAALSVAAVAAVALLAHSGSSSPPTVGPNMVGAIDPATNRIVAAVPVGNTPGAITTGLGSVWVVNGDAQSLSRIDPSTMSSTEIGSLVSPASVATGGGSVWVATADHKLSRVDPATRSVAQTILLPRQASPLAGLASGSFVSSGPAGVWVSGQGTLVQVEPHAETVRLDGCCGLIAVDQGSVWAENESGLVEVDVGSRTATTIPLSFTPSSLAVGAGGIWATDTGGNAAWLIDPATDQVRESVQVASPVAVAVGAGSVWVASTDGTVARIDASSSSPSVVRTFRFDGTPAGIAVGEGRVWVTVD